MRHTINADASAEREGTEVPFYLPAWSAYYLLDFATSLSKRYAWFGTPEEIDAAQADTQKLIYALIRAIEGIVENVRVVNGRIQTLTNGVWTDVSGGDIPALVSCCGYTQEEPSEPRNYNHICAGAKSLGAWVCEKEAEINDQLLGYIQGAKTISSAIFDAISAGLWQASPFDQIVGLLGEYIEFTMQAWIDKLRDGEFIEHVQEELYCVLKANNGQLTDGAIVEWLDNVNQDILGTTATFSSEVQAYIDKEEMRRRYWVYSLDESATCEADYGCADGGEWEYYADFTDGENGWEPVVAGGITYAHWENIDGWVGVQNVNSETNGIIRLKIDLTEQSPITRVVVGYSSTGTVPAQFNGEPMGDLVSGTDLTLDADVTATSNDETWGTRFDAYVGGSSPLITLKSIRIFGTGVNPFL